MYEELTSSKDNPPFVVVHSEGWVVQPAKLGFVIPVEKVMDTLVEAAIDEDAPVRERVMTLPDTDLLRLPSVMVELTVGLPTV